MSDREWSCGVGGLLSWVQKRPPVRRWVGWDGETSGKARLATWLCRLKIINWARCGSLWVVALGASVSSGQYNFERGLDLSWTHLGGNSQRISSVSFPAPPSAVPSWIATRDAFGTPIAFIGQAPLAVYAGSNVGNGRVFAAGRPNITPSPPGSLRLYAFDRSTGANLWEAPIATPYLNSFSAPAIDEKNGTVVYCSGRWVQAFRISDGQRAWRTMLVKNVVNASPLIISDSQERTRLFMTDYEGFGSASRIYSINTDPYDAVHNPYLPGGVVWSAIIGAGSGNSVSYLPPGEGGQGLVFVPTVANTNINNTPQPGVIYAFPLEAIGTAAPVWTFPNIVDEGYFGGLCVVPPPVGSAVNSPPVIYAASYAFAGGTDSANLVKLDARTGDLIWSVPSNRTNSIPVPLPWGFVALAGGIDGLFSSFSQVQLFADGGISGSLHWDTGEELSVGGWTNQPIVTRFGGQNYLAVGSPPTTSWGLSPTLYLLDLGKRPGEPGFVVREYPGVGGSPAMVGSALYCVGTAGLAAFGPTPRDLDVDRSGVVDMGDLYALEVGGAFSDINHDGLENSQDRVILLTALRGGEVAAMKGVR